MSAPIAPLPDSASARRIVKTYKDLLSQLKPFGTGATTTDLPTLIKSEDFEQQWAVILDERGSYLDESGRRIAVRKRLEDGGLSTTNDIDWAAHNAAKFFSMNAIHMARAGVGERPSILWRLVIKSMKRACKEEIHELAIQELGRMKLRPDTRTAVSSVSADAYPYPALLPDPSAIRLVVLLPALEAYADIVCRLCNSTLSRSDIDRYEALSYVWGDPSKRKSITVENRIFQATQNLEAALRNLRYRDRPRVLWIDAICINQNDVMERNTQVQQMDLIYKSSQRVVVWLGPESEDSSDAIRLIRLLPMLDEKITDTEYRTLCIKLLASGLPAIGHLCGRSWFKRIWCIQEFVLGPHATFQCGRDEISWGDFLPLAKLFYDLYDDPTMRDDLQNYSPNGIDMAAFSQLRHLPSLLLWKVGRRHSKSVIALLADFMRWSSSDPRDLIFALYGLVPDGDRDKDILQPDYNLSVSELYTKVAYRLLQSTGDLTILSIATQPPTDLVMQHSWLPCWVPDWRLNQLIGEKRNCSPIAYNGTSTHIASMDTNFDACLGLQATPISLEEDEQVLCLKGVTVDTIEAVGDAYTDRQTSSAHQIVSQWKEIIHLPAAARYPYTGQPVWEAFCRTLMLDSKMEILVGDEGVCRSRIPSQESELGWFRQYFSSTEEESELPIQLTHGPNLIQWNERRFFRTSRGMFGLGPAAARVGDRVVVLFGGRAPFIIRGTRWHHAIGECYVHGIMDGEVIHQPRTEAFQHLQEETFRLG
ncbi:HET domain-containing protein [Trichoderma aethiopicum]